MRRPTAALHRANCDGGQSRFASLFRDARRGLTSTCTQFMRILAELDESWPENTPNRGPRQPYPPTYKKEVQNPSGLA